LIWLGTGVGDGDGVGVGVSVGVEVGVGIGAGATAAAPAGDAIPARANIVTKATTLSLASLRKPTPPPACDGRDKQRMDSSSEASMDGRRFD
jgi:hypothetical protein